MIVVEDLPQAASLLMTDPRSRIVILGSLQEQFINFRSCGGFVFWPYGDVHPPRRLDRGGVRVVAILKLISPSVTEAMWIKSLVVRQDAVPCQRQVSHRETELILEAMIKRVHPAIRPVAYTPPAEVLRSNLEIECRKFIEREGRFGWEIPGRTEAPRLYQMSREQKLGFIGEEIIRIYREMQLEWQADNPKPPRDPYSRTRPLCLADLIRQGARYEHRKGQEEITEIYNRALQHNIDTTRKKVESMYNKLKRQILASRSSEVLL